RTAKPCGQKIDESAHLGRSAPVRQIKRMNPALHQRRRAQPPDIGMSVVQQRLQMALRDLFARQPCRQHHHAKARHGRFLQRLGLIGAQGALDADLLDMIAFGKAPAPFSVGKGESQAGVI
ncbi:hypothetical protein KXV85_006000, partial [Aspergillus fumigatus]